MNEEVVISLRAETQSFKKQMDEVIKSINYATTDMTQLSSMIDVASKKQIKNIASGLQNEIKSATNGLKLLEQDLIKLTNSEYGNQAGIDQIKEDIRNATSNVMELEKSIKLLQEHGGSYRAISKLTWQLNDAKYDLNEMHNRLKTAIATDSKTIGIQKLKTSIEGAKTSISGLQKKLQLVNAQGGATGNIFTKSMSAIGNGFKAIGQSVLGFGKQFGRMIKFSVMFSAISVLRNGLTQAKELSASATNNFGAMGNIIAGSLIPIVEGFANALRKAFVWVAGLVKFITGFDMIAKGIDATNKKINKLGANAKGAGKKIKEGMLSGLDEINNISQQDSGSGGSAGGTDMTAQLGALGSLNDMMAEMQALDFSWAEPLRVVFQFISEHWQIILTGIVALVAAFTTYSVIMGIVNAVMYASPVTWIVAGIAALVAIIIVCIVYWDEIKEAVSKFVESALEWIGNFAKSVGEFFSNIWKGITEWISKVWNGIIGIFQAIIDWVVTNWKSILLFIINPFAGIFNYLYENFEGFRNFVNNIVNAVVGFFKAIPGKVMEFFKILWTGITNLFGGIGSWFGARIDDIINFFKQLPNKVWTFIKSLWDKITGLFSNVGSTVGDAISGAVKGAINTVLKGAVNIINGFISAINLAIKVINAIPGVNIKTLNKLSVPSFDVGTNYVPQDMLAMVHKGERIVPEKYNNDDWVSDGADMTETNSLLEQLINVVASKNFTIGKDAIGKASVDYILAESRRRGEAII